MKYVTLALVALCALAPKTQAQPIYSVSSTGLIAGSVQNSSGQLTFTVTGTSGGYSQSGPVRIGSHSSSALVFQMSQITGFGTGPLTVTITDTEDGEVGTIRIMGGTNGIATNNTSNPLFVSSVSLQTNLMTPASSNVTLMGSYPNSQLTFPSSNTFLFTRTMPSGRMYEVTTPNGITSDLGSASASGGSSNAMGDASLFVRVTPIPEPSSLALAGVVVSLAWRKFNSRRWHRHAPYSNA